MTRLTDAALDALERMANARRNDNGCDFLFVYEFRDLLAAVRASRASPPETATDEVKRLTYRVCELQRELANQQTACRVTLDNVRTLVLASSPGTPATATPETPTPATEIADRLKDPSFCAKVDALVAGMSVKCRCGKESHEHHIPGACDGFMVDLSAPAPSTGTDGAICNAESPVGHHCQHRPHGPGILHMDKHGNEWGARENTGAPDAAEGIAAEIEAKVKAAAAPIFATARAESYAKGRRDERDAILAEFRCELGSYVCDDGRIAPCESCAAARRIRSLSGSPTVAAPSPGIGDQDKETDRG